MIIDFSVAQADFSAIAIRRDHVARKNVDPGHGEPTGLVTALECHKTR